MKLLPLITLVGVVSILTLVNESCQDTKSGNQVEAYMPNDTIKQNVETYWQIMRAAVYDNVTTDKADDYQEDMEWFAGFVKERSERYGELKSIDTPVFSGPGDAAIVVRFEKSAYSFNLAIDSNGEIAQINMANYAPDETLTKRNWEELGDDTLRAQVLDNLSEIKEAFALDNGKVRLVSILSPT